MEGKNINNTFSNKTDVLLKKAVEIITGYKKTNKIYLFGSRAEGNAKINSDIDIAIIDKTWEQKDINIIKNRLEETVSTLLKFDLINPLLINNDKLSENIYKKGKIIYG